MKDNVKNKIEQHFQDRMKHGGLKPGSKKYKDAMADFFAGAMAAMASPVEVERANMSEADYTKQIGEAMPPSWVFGIMRGQIEFKK